MLRKTLGENENGQSYIETVPKRGYRFPANVQQAGNGGDQLVLARHSIVQITAEEDDGVVSRRSEFAEDLEQKLLAAIRERQPWLGWRWGLQAFALLETAYAVHDHQLIFLGVEPEFDPLLSDPRFMDLVRRVGLPQM